jgi:hypothetical protein
VLEYKYFFMLYKFGSMDVDILSYTIGQIETRMLRNSQKKVFQFFMTLTLQPKV